jgi:prepilin-type processing-associated H-X9-DG protein
MQSDSLSGGADGVVRSHRPIHAFRGYNGELDLNKVPYEASQNNGGRAAYIRVRPGEVRRVLPPPPTPLNNKLELVGRNHGRDPKTARTNFLYCDGHVETKTIEETLVPVFQWGATVYSVPRPTVDVDLKYP